VYKLIPVKKVTDLSGAPFVARELMLVKVSRTPSWSHWNIHERDGLLAREAKIPHQPLNVSLLVRWS